MGGDPEAGEYASVVRLTTRLLPRARVDKPIDLAPDKLKAIIDEVVAEMFAKYPTRTKK